MSDKLRELVAKWRSLVPKTVAQDASDRMSDRVYTRCADELESAINAEPQAEPTDDEIGEMLKGGRVKATAVRVGVKPQASDLERADTLITAIFKRSYSGSEAKSFRHAFRRDHKHMIVDEFAAVRAESAAALAQKDAALTWCLENLGAGIEWGGPFDADHPQGEYHCTHCDARWKPNGPGEETHKENCGLLKARAALNPQQKSEGGE